MPAIKSLNSRSGLNLQIFQICRCTTDKQLSFLGMWKDFAVLSNANDNAKDKSWQICTDILMGRFTIKMTLTKLERMHFYHLNLPFDDSNAIIQK